MRTAGYLIVAQAEGKEEKYYAIDEGYGYWSYSLSAARVFSTVDDAKLELSGSDFTKKVEMSDNTIHPPRMLHLGADLDYKHPKGSVVVKICPVIVGECVPSTAITHMIQIERKGEYQVKRI
jgi:hypothetical protein